MRSRKMRSFRLSMSGTDEERDAAKSGSIFLLVACSIFVFKTYHWLSDAHFLVEFFYWEVVSSLLTFALIGFIWAFFRPPRLDRVFESATNRVCMTLLVTAVTGILAPIVAVIVLVLRLL